MGDSLFWQPATLSFFCCSLHYCVCVVLWQTKFSLSLSLRQLRGACVATSIVSLIVADASKSTRHEWYESSVDGTNSPRYEESVIRRFSCWPTFHICWLRWRSPSQLSAAPPCVASTSVWSASASSATAMTCCCTRPNDTRTSTVDTLRSIRIFSPLMLECVRELSEFSTYRPVSCQRYQVLLSSTDD